MVTDPYPWLSVCPTVTTPVFADEEAEENPAKLSTQTHKINKNSSLASHDSTGKEGSN